MWMDTLTALFNVVVLRCYIIVATCLDLQHYQIPHVTTSDLLTYITHYYLYCHICKWK